MKKILAVLLAMVMVLSFAACTKIGGNEEDSTNDAQASNKTSISEDFKVGFIFLHDENSTYDLNFISAAEEACKALGLSEEQYLFKTNISETQDCYDAAIDLVDQGCSLIFADSFGHEDYIIEAAKAHPEVQFCHATGTKAHTSGLSNFHNAFASIYEGRYLAGIAAGMKLNEMIADGQFTAEEAKMGYVGAYTYAEVVSGLTSFYLGAKSVCDTVTMEVQFTGSWYDQTKESEAAKKLIGNKCVLISQHADSMGAPSACEEANVPNVSYNGSTIDACKNTFIVSSKIDWTPYFKYIIQQVLDGKEIDTDWCGSIATGSVVLTDINEAVAAAGTKEKLEEVKSELVAGTLSVFDASKFTVNGEHLTSYMADVNTDDKYEKDTEVITNGIFEESKHRSAPYFDINIDGITYLNTAFGD